MNLAEAERLLRGSMVGIEFKTIADAIRDHLADCGKHDGCVSAEKVRAVMERIDRDNGRLYHDPGMFDVIRKTHKEWLAALLPPEPSALDQAIAIVEAYAVPGSLRYEWMCDLLALLRRAKKDAK